MNKAYLERHTRKALPTEESFFKAYCNGPVCIVYPSWYNRYKPPKPSYPRDLDLNLTSSDCGWDQTQDAAVVYFALSPDKITDWFLEDQMGQIRFESTLSVRWQDPNVS